MSSSLDVDNNAQGNVIVAKMHIVRLCYCALTAAVTKKTTIGDPQGMLNVIQHALTITKILQLISQLCWRSIKKLRIWGEGNSHLVKKLASLCSLSVCFFG